MEIMSMIKYHYHFRHLQNYLHLEIGIKKKKTAATQDDK